MKKQIILRPISILLFLCFSLSIIAQVSTFKSKISLKLSGSLVNSGLDGPVMPNLLFLVEADYAINKFVDVGIYCGSASLMHSYELPYNPITGMYEWYSADSTSYMRSNSSGFYSSSKAYYYGINTNIHLLPFLFQGNMRIDLYATPRIGMVSEQYYEYNEIQELVWSKPFIECSIGLGLKYYFGKHFGIYGEYSLGRFYNSNTSRAMAGLVLKF